MPFRKIAILILSALVASSVAALSANEWKDSFGEDKADLVSSGKNPYFILEPGYVLDLKGSDEGKNAELVITVLNETKLIDGVETRIVEEKESRGGKVIELSRNYFAISKKTNNVYYFGESTTEYRDGKEIKAHDSWMSGVDGATYGLAMPGKPEVGMKYYQEHSPKNAMDRAEVKSIAEKLQVPAGKFEKCLKTEETTPLEKGEKEFKLYAEGVGLLTDEGLKLAHYGFAKK